MNAQEIIKKIDEIKTALQEQEFAKTAQAHIPFEQCGAHITAKRKTAKLTQKSLAALAGVSYGTIQKIERGDENVSVANLLKVLNCLGIKVYIK